GQGPTQQTVANCPTYTYIDPGRTGKQQQVLGDGCIYPQTTDSLPQQFVADGLSWKAYVQGIGEGSPGCPGSGSATSSSSSSTSSTNPAGPAPAPPPTPTPTTTPATPARPSPDPDPDPDPDRCLHDPDPAGRRLNDPVVVDDERRRLPVHGQRL